jgi:hypothetical protein
MKIKCNCKHEYQDGVYGKGVRIATPCKPVNRKPTKARCTVCGTEQGVSEEKKK